MLDGKNKRKAELLALIVGAPEGMMVAKLSNLNQIP